MNIKKYKKIDVEKTEKNTWFYKNAWIIIKNYVWNHLDSL